VPGHGAGDIKISAFAPLHSSAFQIQVRPPYHPHIFLTDSNFPPDYLRISLFSSSFPSEGVMPCEFAGPPALNVCHLIMSNGGIARAWRRIAGFFRYQPFSLQHAG
jgi:hypothetical protein